MKQYIDFYRQQHDSINNNSAPLLNKYRDAALSVVENSALPKIGDENYVITDIKELFAPDYGINSNRLHIPTDVAEAFKCGVPNLSTALYFLLNDTFASANKKGLEGGAIVCSLAEAAVKHSQIVEKYYSQIAPLANPQVALNTLLTQDGLFIYIPDGLHLERPLQIVNILNGTVPMLVSRRILIIMGKGAEAKILSCDHTQNNAIDFLNNQVIEIFSDEDSILDYYDMEESSLRTHRVSSLYAKQEKNSHLLINGITLINGVTRNDINIDIDGEHAQNKLLGMVIGTGTQKVDNHTIINHNVPNGKSNELYKYLLEDEARGSFIGKILVKPGADKTEAYQGNKNIVASDRAKMHTKPQLEIYTDDVKCSHGATIGQLDQKALFYMRTRGISEAAARMLLMQAFMSEVIADMRIDSLRERLRFLVEKRLSGSLTLCNDCGANCYEAINENI